MPISYVTTDPQRKVVAVLQTTSSDRFAESRCFRVFVSYRAGHEQEASHVASRLREFGIDTFVASEDVETGEEWEAMIESAIVNCDALLAYATPDFGEGKWTNREVLMAVRHGKPIYPVATDHLPTGPVGQYQALKLDGGDVPILPFIERYGRWPRMAESIVCAIEQCASRGSFLIANQLASAVSRLSVLNEGQAERLIKAYNSDESHPRFGRHNQIRDALEFRRCGANMNESLLTRKINELTGMTVEHDEIGLIRIVSGHPPRIHRVGPIRTAPEVGDTFDPSVFLPRGQEEVISSY